jgi:hypothetical protein
MAILSYFKSSFGVAHDYVLVGKYDFDFQSVKIYNIGSSLYVYVTKAVLTRIWTNIYKSGED